MAAPMTAMVKKEAVHIERITFEIEDIELVEEQGPPAPELKVKKGSPKWDMWDKLFDRSGGPKWDKWDKAFDES